MTRLALEINTETGEIITVFITINQKDLESDISSYFQYTYANHDDNDGPTYMAWRRHNIIIVPFSGARTKELIKLLTR